MNAVSTNQITDILHLTLMENTSENPYSRISETRILAYFMQWVVSEVIFNLLLKP